VSQIISYNKKQNVSENVVGNFDTLLSNGVEYQDKRDPAKHSISYNQKYQYQTYLQEDKKKFKYTSKTSYAKAKSLIENSILLRAGHEIIFMNGSPHCKGMNWHQQRKHRLMTNNQFYFAKKIFQRWVTQIINSSLLNRFLQTSKNLAALLISQMQSLTFKFFLPPFNIDHRMFGIIIT